MHIPDGLIDLPTSVAAGAIAVAGVAVTLRRAGPAAADRRAPMTGLVAAFVFAAQMVNFPVGAGTSGHLMGGILAAVLVGPWLGALAVTVVLVVQCLLFADGGVTALGLNIVNLALLPAFVAYPVFLAVRRVLPWGPRGVVVAGAVSAWCAVVLASVAFTVEWAVGGSGSVATGTVAASMIGVHVVIGVGEAAITACTLRAVLGSRPDLVHGAIRGAARRRHVAVAR